MPKCKKCGQTERFVWFETAIFEGLYDGVHSIPTETNIIDYGDDAHSIECGVCGTNHVDVESYEHPAPKRGGVSGMDNMFIKKSIVFNA